MRGESVYQRLQTNGNHQSMRNQQFKWHSDKAAQNGMSKTTTIARTRPDGTVVRLIEDGREEAFPLTPMRPMTEAEVHAAAIADPDARPMTQAEWHAARKVPRTKTLRARTDTGGVFRPLPGPSWDRA